MRCQNRFLIAVVGCPAPPDKVVTIGNKNFTEQCIVGQLMKQLLEDRGFTVELKSGRSSACLREGMEFGVSDYRMGELRWLKECLALNKARG